MYHVSVSRNGRIIDRTCVEIGSFREIGYWLDNCGYIEEGCTIKITIVRA